MNIFDANSTGNIYRNTFSKSDLFRITEFILPVESTNYIKTLPLDKDWSHWDNLRPLRLIDHNSNEFTLNVIKDRVRFKTNPPSYAVFTIDPILLGFMYFKYLKEHNFEPPYSPQLYLHRYVTIGLMDDMQDLWLRNELLYLFTIDDFKDFDIYRGMKASNDGLYNYVGLQYTSAMKNVWEEIQKIKDGRSRPEKFLGSLELVSGSVAEICKNLMDEVHIPYLRQYTWQRYVRDRRWVELIIKAFMINPDYHNTIRLKRILFIKGQVVERTRFWDQIRDIPTRRFVQDHFEKTYGTL
jgi:hypothetical protein